MNMNKKAILFLLLLVICSAWSVFGAKVVGTVIYVSGDVTITRNGATMSGGQIRMGSPVEDYDLIRTGAKGLMELTVKTVKNERIQLKVRNNTTFAVEMGKLSAGKEVATFRMMTGTLACKVDKLSGSRVQVKTKSAAMGVRGTEFEVTTAPTEDLLVTCEEGEVVCTREGEEEIVKPGNVIELMADEGKFRNLRVTKAQLANYRKNWFIKRIEVFKAVAPRIVRGLAKTFDVSYRGLIKSYRALNQSSHVINKWKREDRTGKIGSRAELLREKKKIIGALFRIKTSLFIFQHVYYRLLELEYYVEQGYGANDPAVKKFYADLARKKRNIERMLAEITYVFKLYAIRNGGYFPADAIGVDDDHFFDDETDMNGDLDDPGKVDKFFQ
jgi:hypothetical protein